MAETKNLPNLEASLAEITELVNKMEKTDLTLEQSLTHFERGITLVKHCQKVLETAEQKVQILIQNNNQTTLGSYEENQGGNGTDDKQQAK